jgi:hypothetical protein
MFSIPTNSYKKLLKKGESKMPIEFPTGPTTGSMTVEVPDNWPAPPAGPPNILVAGVASNVNITWEIPSPHNMSIGGGFQLRAYVESIGPGQEMQLGPTINVPTVPGQTAYNATIAIPGGTLLGEGQIFNGVPVSGVYKIIAVLQHMNPGPTWISGFAEDSIKMFLSP